MVAAWTPDADALWDAAADEAGVPGVLAAPPLRRERLPVAWLGAVVDVAAAGVVCWAAVVGAASARLAPAAPGRSATVARASTLVLAALISSFRLRLL